MLRCRTSFNKTTNFLQRISFESGHNFPRRGGKSPSLKTSIIQIESPSVSFTTLSHLTKSEIHLKKSPGAEMVVANDRSRRGASLVGAFVEHVIGAARAGADNAHGFSATLRSQTLIACWLALSPHSLILCPRTDLTKRHTLAAANKADFFPTPYSWILTRVACWR